VLLAAKLIPLQTNLESSQENHELSAGATKRRVKMSSSSPILDTLPALDTLFGSIPNERITRPDSEQVNDVIEIDEIDVIPEFIDGKDDELLHCRFFGVLPFKLPEDPDSRCSESIGTRSFIHASAMALALNHLNAGDSSIVSSLGSIREQCRNLMFTIEYLDSRDNPGVAIEEAFGVLERTQQKYGYRMPCSFVGAVRSAVTIPTALLTGHKGYLEVSGSSTAFELDDRVQYPHFARTIPPEQDNVIPIITYFADVLQLKYLALLYVNEPYGNSFAEALARETENRSNGPHIRRISIDSTGDTLQSALNDLKASQYSYILAAMPSTRFYDKLLEEAYRMGVAGNEEYQWYFSDSFHEGGANLTKYSLRMAYNGTGMFRPSAGRLQNNTNFDEFASQLCNLTTSDEDMDYIKHVITSCPEKARESLNCTNMCCNQDEISDSAAFMYDATMAAGISACYGAKYAELRNEQGFNATTQFDILRNVLNFEGATGHNDFDNSTGSRTYTSVFYDLRNYLTKEWLDEETNESKTGFTETVTDIYHRGEWKDGVGEFVFSNGMGILERPYELQPITAKGNLTPTYMKGIAMFFSSFSILVAFCFAVWTWRHRKTRVIMASQPFFLYLVLLGVALVAASIIPYTIDDQTFSQSVCDKACSAVLWLLFPGLSIVFSALYTKTYRINLIMMNSKKFRRVKVTVRETLSTMAVMLLLNVITLTVMTILDPPHYERRVQFDDQFDRPTSTYGSCVWKDQVGYIICLFAINFLIASLSAYQSFKARSLSTEFAESKYIFATLLVTLTLLMVGLPVTIMSAANPTIAVFTYSAAVHIFCMAVFVLILWPKVSYHYKGKGQTRKSGTFIGGLHPSPAIPNGGAIGNTSNDTGGDIILTTTSPRMLAKQVTELQRLVQEKERELDEYKFNRVDENTTNITTS